MNFCVAKIQAPAKLRQYGRSVAEHMKEAFFIYILTSIQDPAKVYIGRTSNLNKRLSEHNRGESTYSKTFAPWKMETYIAFSDERSAEAFEKYLKAGSGHVFLKKHLLPK